MPQVPVYNRQVATQATPNVRVAPQVADTRGLQQGLGEAAAVGNEILVRQREQADTTAVIEADNKLTEWQNNALYNKDGGAYTKKGAQALDITGQTLGSFEKAQQEISAGLSNERQRARFTQIAGQRQRSLSADLNRYEFGQHQQYMDDVDNSSIKLSQDSAVLNYNDPSKVDQFRQKALAVIDSKAQRSGWSPEQTELAKLETSSGMYTGVISQLVNDDPHKARQFFEQSKGSMSAQDQVRASSQIDQGFRRLEAEARQRQVEARQMQAINRMELHSRVQDAQAAWMQGFEFDNPPNKADFQAAYGNKADQAYESFSKVQAVAPAIREFATATPEEQKQIINKFRPAQDGTATAGFQEDDSLYRRLVSVGTGLLRQQHEDPAGYVAKYSPAVRDSFAQAQQLNTPEAYNAYATATIAEQQRLGIQSPKLLPKAAADQIANAFSNPRAGGENAATLIEQQQQQWGKNFPLIAQQLGDKLPQEAQVIAAGVPKDIGERLATVAQLSEADLKQGLEKGVASEVATSVQSELADFAKSLSGQAGGINTFNTTYQAANKAALSYVRQGMKPAEAARKVVAGIVNDKYEFVDNYRVPKSQNVPAVRAGAEHSLETLSPDELMPLKGLPGVTPEENVRQLHDAVIGGGQWVPTNDESGLALTLNGYRVLGKDGRPIVRSWQDLEAAGMKKPAKPTSAPVLGIYN